VAVKVLRSDLARDPSFQGRFRREAQAAASLNAPVDRVGLRHRRGRGGVPYIVMEFVDGRTLRDVLLEEGRLLPQRALEVTAEVCAALDAAHTAGIVHRDIKPGNVMLTRSGEVKVMDFGIARAASDASSAMTQTSAVIGTAAYLSPEQARGEHVDAARDLYSTGCLLYELITGAPPVHRRQPGRGRLPARARGPAAPVGVRRDAPASVDAVVLKAMAKNPGNRYQSADEMREDLLRAARAGGARDTGPRAARGAGAGGGRLPGPGRAEAVRQAGHRLRAVRPAADRHRHHHRAAREGRPRHRRRSGRRARPGRACRRTRPSPS
jgi:serine/threonine-protein kinase